jgi:hypothetical protein
MVPYTRMMATQICATACCLRQVLRQFPNALIELSNDFLEVGHLFVSCFRLIVDGSSEPGNEGLQFDFDNSIRRLPSSSYQ